MIDDWVLEGQRSEIEQKRSMIESIQPTNDWSIFVHCVAIEYMTLREPMYIESLSFSDDEKLMMEQRAIFALCFGIDPMYL